MSANNLVRCSVTRELNIKTELSSMARPMIPNFQPTGLLGTASDHS